MNIYTYVHFWINFSLYTNTTDASLSFWARALNIMSGWEISPARVNLIIQADIYLNDEILSAAFAAEANARCLELPAHSGSAHPLSGSYSVLILPPSHHRQIKTDGRILPFFFFLSGPNVHFIQWQRRSLPEADGANVWELSWKAHSALRPCYFLPSASLWCVAALAAGLR